MTNSPLHLISGSGRNMCGLKGGKGTQVLDDVTCKRCRKVGKISTKLNEAIDETENPTTPEDMEAKIERLRKKFAPLKEAMESAFLKSLPPEDPITTARANGWRGMPDEDVVEPKRRPLAPVNWNQKRQIVKPTKDKNGKEFPICMCGCKEHTRGGKFRPGHDARYYQALRRAGEDVPHLRHQERRGA